MKKYFLQIYGCQMNWTDAERLAQVLTDLGYLRCEQMSQASLVVVVACSVRAKAVSRLFGLAQNLAKLRPRPVGILTGCVMPSDKIKFAKKFDYVLEISEIINLPKILGVKAKQRLQRDYLSLLPLYNSKFQAYVPIMTGCNNFCSYCVVPYVRGRERSRPAGSILTEVKNLIKRGYKEITLVGQNVNSYHYGSVTFPRLLKKIDNLPGVYWLRFLTSHPKDLSNELIAVLSRAKHWQPYLHLPCQAGDNQILKQMNRGYTRQQYLALIKKIRKAVPRLALTTDVIVGFPGETKQQFKQTKDLFKQADFAMAYLAQYSPRPGTSAVKLLDNVSLPEKKRRWQELNKILWQSSQRFNRKLLGQTVLVLVEKSFLANKQYSNFGKTASFREVQFFSKNNLLGKFVSVRITKIGAFSVFGKLVN